MVNNISKSEEKKILPIFYNVEPKDVDLKTSLYTTAIKKHKEFPDEGEYWEGALQLIDKIKGWELEKCKSNAELMKLAVREVLHQLKSKSKIVTKDLVGLDGPVREVLKRLDVNCTDVRLLGIHGMGGVGKTTLAKFIYNELHSRFEKRCAFLADVRETSKKEGLLKLQKNLLTEIVSSKAAEIINDVDYGRERIEKTLGRNKDSEKVPGNEETLGRNKDSKKFLIVLDDVGEKEQIENLIGRCPLQPGTRVIITTRNTSVLEFVEMNSDHALPILSFEMKEMNPNDALQLFKRHAFLEGSLAKDFDKLSKDIVSTTGGLPLALRVVGSLLCRKPKAKWEKTLKQLMKIPHKDVQKTLMISYNDLNYRQREIFLDIACFFINEDMENANYMWEACEFHPNVEIDVLVKRSLINVKDNKFWMHDQLRDLGREIVCQESPTILGRRSRLWTNEEVLDLVRTNLRKKKVEAIDLRGSSHISIKNEEIERFESLRFLRLSNGTLHGNFTDCLPMLKWISWSSPLPYCSVVNMHLKNLVVLEFFDNHFTNDSKVWDSLKMATKLKSVALVKCHRITRTPDLSKCLALERLTFDDCGRLTVIDSSIGMLEKLDRFSLKRCYKIGKLPTSIGKLGHLSVLNLLGLGITELPNTIEGLVELQRFCLKDTKIRQLPNSIGKLASLRTLDLSREKIEKTTDRWELPKAIGTLDKLEELYLGKRNELVGEIPDEIGDLSSLRDLDLRWTSICRVPETINRLSCLSILDLRRCDEIKELPKLPTSLVSLHVESRSLEVVPNLSELTNLIELFLSDGSRLCVDSRSSNLKHMCDLRWIEGLTKLEKLNLNLVNVAALPTESGSHHLKDHSLPSSELNDFRLTGSLLSNLENLSKLTLHISRVQEMQLGGLLQLQYLTLGFCDLQSLSIPSSLRTLRVYECPNMTEIQFPGTSASLEELAIEHCMLIGKIVLPNALKKLKKFELMDCENVPEIQVIGTLFSLQDISIYECNAMVKLSGVSNLKNLQSLCICFCQNLRFVEGLDELESLICLDVSFCPSLEILLDRSNSKILERCLINVSQCGELLNSSSEGFITFNSYKGMAQQGAPQPETNKEKAKMEGHAEKPNTELQLQLHPFASSQDHDISKEPPIDNVKEGTLPRNQNKMRQQDSNPSSISPLSSTKLQLQFHPSARSRDREINEEPPMDDVREGTPLGNQNQTGEQDLNPLSKSPLSSTGLLLQFHPSSSRDHEINEESTIDDGREGTLPGNKNRTREPDSKPQSLDELARPRTFSDRFMTCLVSILECVCNRDFT